METYTDTAWPPQGSGAIEAPSPAAPAGGWVHPARSETTTSFGARRDVRWPGNAANFEVWTDRRRIVLRDFSLRGLGVLLPNAKWARRDSLDLELRHAHQSFARLTLDVTHVASSSAGDLLGGIIRSSLPVATREEYPGMGDSVEIQDAAQRLAILHRLQSSAEPAVVHFADGTQVLAKIKTIAIEHGLTIDLSEGTDARLGGGMVFLEATLSGSAFSVQGHLARSAAGTPVLIEPRIFSVGRRQHERIRSWKQRPTLTWRHPLDPGYWVSALVDDLSPKGAAISFDSDRVAFLPPPPAPLLLTVNDVQVPILAEVRHSTRSPTGATKVGLRIAPQAKSDVAQLTRACQAARFPMLVPRGHVPPNAVDQLMRESGYLSLRESATPAMGWHSPANDDQLTVDLVHRSNTGSPTGHGSYLRIYPNTWLFHQLATVGLRRANVAFPLYAQAAEWALALTEDDVFGMSYFDQAKTWHKAMLGDFLRWVGSDALSTITSLDRLERCTATAAEPVADPRVHVRLASTGDRRFIAELVRCYLPPLVADALHISEGTIQSGNLCTQHDAVGLERSRKAFVVEVDGRLEAAALCETGSRTLSLFNILNMAHVFVKRTTAPHVARSVQVELLRAVLDFYSRRGIWDPVVVTPQGSIAHAKMVGLTIAESMGCWVASREGLKQWRNYTQFALGTLYHRSRGKRDRHEGGPNVER